MKSIFSFFLSSFLFVGPLLPTQYWCRGLFLHLDHTQWHTLIFSVGLLWTGDRPVAETSTRNTQHLQNTDNSVPGGIITHDPSKRGASNPRPRPRGHRGKSILLEKIYCLYLFKVFFLHKTPNFTSIFTKYILSWPSLTHLTHIYTASRRPTSEFFSWTLLQKFSTQDPKRSVFPMPIP
jgi:hypothetical protein